MGLGDIVRRSKISRTLLTAVAAASFYLTTPSEARATEPIAAVSNVANIKITYPWKAPKTIDEKAIYNQLVKRLGTTKADIKFMEYARLKKAGIFAEETLENLVKTTNSKTLNAKGWYKLLTGEKGKALEEVAGKITINGTPTNLRDATNYTLNNKVNYQFVQETSEGLKIEIGEYQPSFQIADTTKIVNQSTLIPKKYHVVIEGFDSEKKFTTEEAADAYSKKLTNDGYDTRVVHEDNLEQILKEEELKRQAIEKLVEEPKQYFKKPAEKPRYDDGFQAEYQLNSGDFCTSLGDQFERNGQVYIRKKKDVFRADEELINLCGIVEGYNGQIWKVEMIAPDGKIYTLQKRRVPCSKAGGVIGSLNIKDALKAYGAGKYKIIHYMGKPKLFSQPEFKEIGSTEFRIVEK